MSRKLAEGLSRPNGSCSELSRRLHTVLYFDRRLTKQFFVLFIAISMVFSVAIVVSTMVSADAQFDEEDAEIDDLKEERERAVKEAAIAVSDIDVVNSTVEEVTKALDDLSALVDLQELRVEEAESSYQGALDSIDNARAAREDLLVQIDILEVHLTNLAVASFTGEGSSGNDDITKLLLSDDPGESARFLHLLEQQTGSLNDGMDRLRGLESEALQLVLVEESAVADAERLLEEVEERNAELEDALMRQERVVAAAELRLEAQVAEAAVLQERDSELATLIRDKQSSINQRVSASARQNGIEIPEPVDLDDITTLDFYEPGVLPEAQIDPDTGERLPVLIPLDVSPRFQLEVNDAIAAQAKALYDEAFAQGIDLGGWGYRPIQLQIELRAAQCGGSEFDIWHKPVSQCSPPTARAGFSRHEQGRAIDFQFNGASIRSQDSAGFRWLAAHAPKYGFVNLPSEPWHWSITEGDELWPNGLQPLPDEEG